MAKSKTPKNVFKASEVEPRGTGWIVDLSPEGNTVNPDCYYRFQTRAEAIAFAESVQPVRLVNISERYGGKERATLADYLALNPGGKFEAAPDGIYEWALDHNGEERRERVAELATN